LPQYFSDQNKYMFNIEYGETNNLPPYQTSQLQMSSL